MLEDKELGLKIAESPEEDFWTRVKEAQEKEKFNSQRSIEIAEWILKLVDSKLKELGK